MDGPWKLGDSLRTGLRSLHLWTLPTEVSLASSNKAWGEDGNLSDPEVSAKLSCLGSGLVDAVRRFVPPSHV